MEQRSTIHNTASRRRIWLGWTGVALAVGLTTAVSAAAIGNAAVPLGVGNTAPSQASYPSAVQSRYVACMHRVGTNPDALEHWVDTCWERAMARSGVSDLTSASRTYPSAVQVRYLGCISHVGSNPDALEHWVDVCRARSLDGSLSGEHD
jgi:hypothetical protein